ncbi:MAG: hypothetical protein K6G56_01790 [Clostridiales bacterium]|nr:hypothetical protein [Clostridiales bacterium]
MKRTVLILLLLSALLFAGCRSGEHSALATDVPTEAPAETAALSETPSPEPYEEPTPEPTSVPEPTAEPEPTEVPDFPKPPATGRLTDGPIAPEGTKYIVLSGESDHRYVFDENGVFLRVFCATEEWDNSTGDGFYGEDGIAFSYMLKNGAHMPDFKVFGDVALLIEFYSDDGEDGEHDFGYELREVRDGYLRNPIRFEKGELRIGYLGGLLPMEDGYLIIERGDSFAIEQMIADSVMIKLDKSFKKIDERDASPFGFICGAIGGRYIVSKTGGRDDDETETYDLYNMEGNRIFDDIKPIWYATTSLDDELDYYFTMSLGDYFRDKNGVLYDKSLQPIDSIPEDDGRINFAAMYRPLWSEDFRLVTYGAFIGVTDAEGNWLFRIYNPELVSDSRRIY